MEAFLTLNEVDLKDLGVTHRDARQQILSAINELNSGKVSLIYIPAQGHNKVSIMGKGDNGILHELLLLLYYLKGP